MNILKLSRASCILKPDRERNRIGILLEILDFSKLGSSLDESFEKIPAAFDEIISYFLKEYTEEPIRITVDVMHPSANDGVYFIHQPVDEVTGKLIMDALGDGQKIDISKPFRLELSIQRPIMDFHKIDRLYWEYE